MKTFRYYSKADPKEETISKTEANNMQDAVLFFARRKSLDIKTFRELFLTTQIN